MVANRNQAVANAMEARKDLGPYLKHIVRMYKLVTRAMCIHPYGWSAFGKYPDQFTGYLWLYDRLFYSPLPDATASRETPRWNVFGILIVPVLIVGAVAHICVYSGTRIWMAVTAYTAMFPIISGCLSDGIEGNRMRHSTYPLMILLAMLLLSAGYQRCFSRRPALANLVSGSGQRDEQEGLRVSPPGYTSKLMRYFRFSAFRKQPIWALILLTALSTLAYEAWLFRLPTGEVRAEIIFPAKSDWGADPVLVNGVPKAADFVFVNYLGPGRVRFGYDSWGYGGPFSTLLSVEPGKSYVVEIDVPSLHIEETNPRGQLLVKLNGQNVLQGIVHSHIESKGPLYVGSNPVGGTVCGPIFSGKIRNLRTRLITPAALWASAESQLPNLPLTIASMFALSLLVVLAAQGSSRERRAMVRRVWTPVLQTGSGRLPEFRVLVFLAGLTAFVVMSVNRFTGFALPEHKLDLVSQADNIASPARRYLATRKTGFAPADVPIGGMNADPAWAACDYLWCTMLPYYTNAVPPGNDPPAYPYLIFVGNPGGAEKPDVQASRFRNYRIEAPLTPEAFLLVRSKP